MKKKLIVLSSVLGLTPFLALAQNSGCNAPQALQPGNIQFIICRIGDILNTIIPILVILGVVYFIWGVISYVIGNDEEAKKKGRNRMIYGIIGLVVIVAMWGLVSIVNRTFGLGVGTQAPITPSLPY
jgi:hypothetical protein